MPNVAAMLGAKAPGPWASDVVDRTHRKLVAAIFAGDARAALQFLTLGHAVLYRETLVQVKVRRQVRGQDMPPELAAQMEPQA